MMQRIHQGMTRRLLFLQARVQRRRLQDTTFVAITGSSGKTTTKDLIFVVLSCQSPGRQSHESENTAVAVARTLISIQATDRFCVQEIGINPWSSNPHLDRPLQLYRPDMTVVTNVGSDHCDIFSSLEAIAAEKGKAVAALPASGTAVLNYDDPRVLAMRTLCRGQVITYGLSASADIRAENICSTWPQLLSFRIRYGSQSLPVQTQFCGAHWTSAVLAAMASGIALGVSLPSAIQAIQKYRPASGRMSAERHDDGVTFVRDDWKAGLSTIEPAMAFLRDARAARKLIVIGTITHMPGSPAHHYRHVAEQGRRVADSVYFVGPLAVKALDGARDRGFRGADINSFHSIQDLAVHLRRELQAGDLVLLKGSHVHDHLERLALMRSEAVGCWRPACGKHHRCHGCDLIQVPGSEELGTGTGLSPSRRQRRDPAQQDRSQ